MVSKIAFGGGCHWCTEAIFKSLNGVERVEQGYVSSVEDNTFSEAVIVHFLANKILLKTLIEIHIHTHKSTSNDSIRSKYRSAVYVFSKAQARESENIICQLQNDFEQSLVTKVFTFKKFKASRKSLRDYY